MNIKLFLFLTTFLLYNNFIYSQCGGCTDPENVIINNGCHTFTTAVDADEYYWEICSGNAGIIGSNTSSTVFVDNPSVTDYKIKLVVFDNGNCNEACKMVSTGLSNNLLLHYPFNGNALDISANNFHGSASGVTYTANRFGLPNGAASFDGVNDFINLPNNLALKPNLPVSFSFWIWYETNDHNDQAVFNTSYEEDRSSGVYFNAQISTGNYGINYGDGSNFYNPTVRRTYVSNQQIETQNWHHIVAIVRGPTDISIYVNCIEQGGTYSGTGGNLVYSSTPGSIGRRDRDLGTPALYFKGKLDDFMYWDRAVTEEEVFQLCNCGGEEAPIQK